MTATATVEQEATALLKQMADFIAKMQRFSVTMRIDYDVVQESGQKIEFGEIRKVTIRRPDRLRAEVERSDGDQGLVVFDGKDIAVFNAEENVFATASKPGNLDQAITYFLKDLRMRMPLALLLVSTFPTELERRVKTVEYVERTTLLGVPCDHLAARSETVDFQIWIAQGDQPLPQRVVITYKQAEGQPQFRAQFLNWNLAPELSESLFTFAPPAGAERIPFLAQVPHSGKAPKQTGDRP